ncbi:uncharacterized protein Fa2h [Eurosta solidaginis]|uniref:uncharacterized protein Fa2h n=1 Tax=Eurosta solidaginis TaxID=178769 RepID=UPI003530BE88
MPTTVSDLTLSTTTINTMSNGKIVQIQSEELQQQANHVQIHTFNRNFLNKNKKEAQFIVKYRNKYYDIERFVRNHPGGVNTLRGLYDGDMTTRFLHAPPHSDAAMYLMKEYEIKPQLIQLQNGVKRRHHLQPIPIDREQEQTLDAATSLNGVELIADAGQEDKNNNQLDESMEHLVDWSKAMVPQISHITRYYDEWVHKPVDRPLRLFGPSYLEVFTRTPWWLIPLFWIPVISNCIWDEYTEKWSTASMSRLMIFAINFIAGTIFWTLLEYMLHRFVFHMKINANTKPWLCTFHFVIHGLHHKVPFDSKRLVFPPLPGVIIATVIYKPISFLLPYPRIVLAGALLGYICYDLMHYYLHYGNPSLQRTRFMYHMKRYHYQHHFAHQDMGYGISSPLWDMVFNTRIHLRQLRFPLRWR